MFNTSVVLRSIKKQIQSQLVLQVQLWKIDFIFNEFLLNVFL